jgi:hypothetical protein
MSWSSDCRTPPSSRAIGLAPRRPPSAILQPIVEELMSAPLDASAASNKPVIRRAQSNLKRPGPGWRERHRELDGLTRYTELGRPTTHGGAEMTRVETEYTSEKRLRGQVIERNRGAAALDGAAQATRAQATPTVDNVGNRVLGEVQVYLVFWGSYWQGSPSPPVAAVEKAVREIVGGPYMSGLAQYHGVINGQVKNALIVTSPVPTQTFSDDDVSGLVEGCIETGSLPKPAAGADLLYAVFLPPGCTSSDNPSYAGEHSTISVDGHDGAFAWITTEGSLGQLTATFSHELVEACTNPYGNTMWMQGACGHYDRCEIADVCGIGRTRVDGNLVSTYWSVRDGACIAPTGPKAAEVWRDTWTSGWTHFALVATAGPPVYVAYKAAEGAASIDRVDPDGHGVETIWTNALPPGSTSLFTLELADGPYLMSHDQATRHTEIRAIKPDGSGLDPNPVWEATWGNGYALFMPFRRGSDAFYIAYDAGNGGVAIDRVNPQGQDVTNVFDSSWTLGWTHLTPFESSGDLYYLAYKQGDGHVSIDEISADGTQIKTAWTGEMKRGATWIDTFVVGGKRYFQLYDADDGFTHIWHFRKGASQWLERVWWGFWTPGWTSCLPLKLDSGPGHLVYKHDDGTAAIDHYLA